jgi:rhodanese-related sulfurtransferase
VVTTLAPATATAVRAPAPTTAAFTTAAPIGGAPAPAAFAPASFGPFPVPPAGSLGIADILAAARARLDRVGPRDAHLAQLDGAVLVDIRPASQRAEHGEIPGAIIIERNVLEWRLDPRSDARLSFAGGYDLRVIVVCQEGYTSSLAAAALQDLGLSRATDLDGGFTAWQNAALPTLPPLTLPT